MNYSTKHLARLILFTLIALLTSFVFNELKAAPLGEVHDHKDKSQSRSVKHLTYTEHANQRALDVSAFLKTDNGDGTFGVLLSDGDGGSYVTMNRSQFLESTLSGEKTINGTQLIDSPDPRWWVKFDNDLQTSKIESTTTGTGSFSHLSSSQASLSTGATSGSSVLIQGNFSLDYIPGISNYTQFTLAVPQPPTAANSFVAAGQHNFPAASFNGFAIGYSGLDFCIFHLNNGAVEIIRQANFSDDKLDGNAENSRFTDEDGNVVALDPTKGNLYRIVWLWHGYGPAIFQVKNHKTWITFHTFYWVNENQIPHMSEPDLPFTLYVNNGSSTTDVNAYIASATLGRMGRVKPLVTDDFEQLSAIYHNGSEIDYDRGTSTSQTIRFTQATDDDYALASKQDDIISALTAPLGGTLTAYSGTATTSVSNIPSTAGNNIVEAIIKNDDVFTDLLVSFDGGTTYFTIDPRSSLSIDKVRGNITQVKLKTNAGTASYDAILGAE